MKVLITICEGEVCVDFPDMQERYMGMTVGELGEMINNLRAAGYEVPNPDFM